MQRILKQIFLVLICCGLWPTYAAEPVATLSPIGNWKTIDDVSGKPKSIIQITETADHTLMGKVLKIYPKAGEDQNKVCQHCEGNKHNQPIVGMIVLYGLTLQEGQWKGGEILDPENGKTYRCMLRTTDNGKKLDVHGYIGMPLLGRSQSWERTDASI